MPLSLRAAQYPVSVVRMLREVLKFSYSKTRIERFPISSSVWGHKQSTIICYIHRVWIRRIKSNEVLIRMDRVTTLSAGDVLYLPTTRGISLAPIKMDGAQVNDIFITRMRCPAPVVPSLPVFDHER